MASTSVLIDIVGRDNASSTFMRVAGAAEKSGSRMSRAFGGALVTLGKLGLAVGVFEAIHAAINITKDAAQFQRSMTLIQTQAGASAAEVRKFSIAILAMSGKVAQAPEELATSLYHVYSVGLRGAKALDVVRIAAEGARIGNANLEDTTNALTSSVASGIKGVQNMSQAMGALNAIVGAGDMKLSDLNEALSSGLLTVAKSFGVSLKQVGAALATFGDNNIRGAQAATQLRMSILALANPIQGGAAALDQIGESGARLQRILTHQGLTAALDDLHAHLKAAGKTGSQVGGVLEEAFGRRAGVGITILENQLDRYHLKLEAVAAGAHDFGSDWQTTQKTTSFVFAKLGDMAQAWGISVATKLLPPITQFAAKVGVDLPKAFGVAEAILKPFAADVGGVLVGAWHTFSAVLSGVGDVLRPVVSLITALRVPLGALATAATGAWIAFKLGSAIPAIFETIALRLMYAKDAVVGFGVSAKVMASTFIGSAAAVETTAATTAGSVAASGEVAGVGWAGILGPLAAVGVGIALLVSAFHQSSAASKEASAAAQAYTDALSSSGSGKTSILDTITKQLAGNDVPEKIRQLNGALGDTATVGHQFVAAIMHGGPALDSLRTHLNDVIKSGTVMTDVTEHGVTKSLIDHLTPAAIAASKLLVDLNAQFGGLTKAQAKEIAGLKTFGTTAVAIGQVTKSMKIGSQTASTYAAMLGFAADENGVVALRAGQSAQDVHDAIAKVSAAYKQATQTGVEFLGALQTFSQSAGTAADRAALIGATLKAANGDALNFAAQMNATAGAAHDFGSGIAQAAKQVGKNGESTKAFLASIVNLKTGTINYNKQAAGPLISGLQSIQSAALAAAQATFQHNKAQEGGRQAATDAYNEYRSQTRPQLVDQLKNLGLNTTQAKTLARTYFGMPKSVKTLIKQEGGDPILTVLNKIGQQLADISGHPWLTSLTANTDGATTALNLVIGKLQTIGHGATAVVNVITKTGTVKASASGGHIRGPGTGTSDSIPAMLSNGEFVINAKQTSRHLELLHAINSGVQGFAGGGPITTKMVGGKKEWLYGGQEYASRMAADNARARAGKTSQSSLSSAVSSILGGIGSAPSSKFNIGDIGINRVMSQIGHASHVLEEKISEGLSQHAAKKYEKELARYTKLAQHQLVNLRVRIRKHDLDTITHALGKTPADIRTAFAALFTDIQHAGGAGQRVMDGLHKAQQRLIADQRQITHDQARIAAARQYRSGIRSTLAGQYDLTQSGSVSDFITGLHGATATNRAYKSELTTLRGRYRGNKAGLALINKLAASGQTATLESLASASKAQDLQAAKAYGGYTGSLTGASNAAVMVHLGKSVGDLVAELRQDRKHEHNVNEKLAHLVTLIARSKVQIGDKEIGTIADEHVHRALQELEHLIRQGQS